MLNLNKNHNCILINNFIDKKIIIIYLLIKIKYIKMSEQELKVWKQKDK